MVLEIPNNLIHAAFFFVDIVGLSSPVMSTNTQTVKITMLNKIIGECDAFKSVSKDEKLVLPTGDGMAIGFVNYLEGPLQLSKELHGKLNKYNENQDEMDKILIRIGCHSGNIFVVDDVNGNKNFWGPGLILARRVMDIGNANHILMTSSMAESLSELSDDFKKIIHPLHDYKIKHGDVIFLYSVYDDSIGNSKMPSKGTAGEINSIKEIHTRRKTIVYNNVQYTVKLKDQHTKSFEFTRIYEFINNSDDPLFQVVNRIITTVEKTFDALNVKTIDNDGRELKILGVNADAPLWKEFTLKLNKPLFRGDKIKYSINYKSEEPNNYHENMFLINSEKFSLRFIFPTETNLNPQLYAIENKDREKKLVERIPTKKEGVVTQLEWKKVDGIKENDIIRLEW
jgi:hypothetical protein